MWLVRDFTVRVTSGSVKVRQSIKINQCPAIDVLELLGLVMLAWVMVILLR